MLLHFGLMQPGGPLEATVAQIYGLGWTGVDLFFVLSGFLITGILLDTRGDPHYYRNFYARRTLRIFPLYYAYLFLLFVVLPLVSSAYAAEHAASDQRIWLWTYLGNMLMGTGGWEAMPSHTTHLWSLAIEEQFYLVWPLLVALVPREKTARLCQITFVVAILTRAYLWASGALPAASYVFTPARVDTLAAGAYVAVLLRDGGPDVVNRASKYFMGAGLSLIAAGTLWTQLHGQHSLLPTLDLGTQQFAYPGIALLFAGVVARAVTNPPYSATIRFLSKPSLRALGKYSYALYLLHVPMRDLFLIVLDDVGGMPRMLGSALPFQLVLSVAGIGISLGLALVSWNVFEKPILKLKRYF
jgi:peptidoglycan/LPS O-acetylase OafA/YrhL